MKRTLLSALLLCLAGTAVAADGNLAKADKSVGKVLDTLGYNYEVDEDGDYKLLFDTEDDRSQLLYVRSFVTDYDGQKIREIWSPGYQSPTSNFPAGVANRLLESSHLAKLGAWVKQGDTAMFVVKIPADASAVVLSHAIDAAYVTADAMEFELTSQDDF